MSRKIIQIATYDKNSLVALADDGTVWHRSVPGKFDCGFNSYWYQTPNIPQE